jgi:hypothetical protein
VSNWRSLFDGKTLKGWFAAPRSYGTVAPGGPAVITPDSGLPLDYNARAAEHPAIWTVEDGAIVGRQAPDAPGWGGYLVSEESFGSFELELEMRPDWPADTGVMIRRRRDSWEGLQVLVDHRRSGSIGGVYGNGIGGFHGVPFAIDAATDARGRPIGLIEDDPATSLEEFTEAKRAMLTRAGSAEEFLAAWRWNDWNSLPRRGGRLLVLHVPGVRGRHGVEPPRRTRTPRLRGPRQRSAHGGGAMGSWRRLPVARCADQEALTRGKAGLSP